MVLEVVQIKIKPGTREEFEASFAKAIPIYARAKGWRNTRLSRSVEHENRYLLFVEWDSIEDHVVTFRESEGFQQYRALVGAFFEEMPVVEHVEQVVAGP